VLGYDLQPGVDEEPVTVEFSSGIATVCLECTAWNGKNGSDGRQFLGGQLTCPAPAKCPSETGSPSGAFVGEE
jgi:hypothetical protein